MSGWGEAAGSEYAASPHPSRVAADPPPPGEGGLSLCGETVIPDASGVLWWPAERTLIVADLHLEKGSAHAARGAMLPPYDTAATLAMLESVLVRLRPGRVVALGDSFHDRRAGGRIAPRDREHLARLQDGREWIWIAGNHDPDPPDGVAGRWYEELSMGPLMFRHEPARGAAEGEVAGHLHPVARVHVKGRNLRRRCFASDGRRAVLPAFGAFTGGLNVLDRAYAGLFEPRAFDAWMIGARAVYRFAARRLVAG